jgi:hypothetical protein
VKTTVKDVAKFLGETPAWVYQNTEKLYHAAPRVTSPHYVYTLFLNKIEVMSLESFPFKDMLTNNVKAILRYMRQGEMRDMRKGLEDFEVVADFVIAKKLISPKQSVSNTLVYLEKYTKKEWRGINLKQVFINRYLQLIKKVKIKINAETKQEKQWRNYILNSL